MSEYLYQIGDKVMIREDLSLSKAYRMRSGENIGGFPGINRHMVNRSGEIHTIIAHTGIGYYCIDDEPDEEHDYNGNWYWSDEMFEPIGMSECVCKSLL